DLFHGSANPSVAYLAGSGEVKVRLSAKAPTRREAEALIDPVAEEVLRRIGDRVFTTRDEGLEEVVGRLLTARGLVVSAAESLTGGGLGVRLSSQPGSSAFFAGSAVCYSAEAKIAVLGVSRAGGRRPGHHLGGAGLRRWGATRPSAPRRRRFGCSSPSTCPPP